MSYVHEQCLRVALHEEPVLFTKTDTDDAGFDESCRLRRHRFYYGGEHLPLPKEKSLWGEAGPSVATHLLTVANIRPVAEVTMSVDVRAYAQRLEPFVIRGGASNLSAIKRWSDSYLRSSFARSNAWHRQWFERSLQDKSSTEYQSIDLQKVNVFQLMMDARVPSLYRHKARSLERISFWYTTRGLTKSLLHRDDGNFVIAQVDGTKTWTLVDPEDSLRLYPDWSNLYNLSPVDPTNVRLDLYPDVEGVPVKVVRIHPGDLLYVPIDTWHFVESAQGRNNMLTFQFGEWSFGQVSSHYSVNFTAHLDQYRRRVNSSRSLVSHDADGRDIIRRRR